jgi:hypothetical protein
LQSTVLIIPQFPSQSPDLQRFFRFSPLLLSDGWFLPDNMPLLPDNMPLLPDNMGLLRNNGMLLYEGWPFAHADMRTSGH